MMAGYNGLKVKNKLGVVDIRGTQGDIKQASVNIIDRLLCTNVQLSYSRTGTIQVHIKMSFRHFAGFFFFFKKEE